MSWRWQINNHPRQIASLLTLQQQQQQQQQQQPVRWIHEYQHQLTEAQLCQQLQLQQQFQLQDNVQQHMQSQYPLQKRVPSPWPDMSSSHTSQSVCAQARSARRELYEDIFPTRNVRTTQSENRHNFLYHEGKGNDYPLQEARNELFYPEHRNRQFLNEVHHSQNGLREEFLPTRNVQQTTESDYRCNGLYYQELQNRFPYYNERSKIFPTKDENRRFFDEQSNEFRRRMWRAQTPSSTFERQHPYHRSLRDRSVGPDQRCRRYRSKSVGPELGYQRKYDTDSKGKKSNGEDKLSYKQNGRKCLSSCSDCTDMGENNNKYGNSWNTGPNLCDENRLKIKKNAHSVSHQPKFRKRKCSSVSPAKDTSSAIDAIKNKRRNVCKSEKVTNIANDSSIMPNSDSASANNHKSPHVQENRVENASFTGITRTVSNVAEETPQKLSPDERNGNDGSSSRNWQLTPLDNVELNRSHTPLCGITRTVLNVHADRTHAHKVGERNHRLRSFREEEKEDETPEEEEEEEEDAGEEDADEEEDGGNDDDSGAVEEEINTHKNVQRDRDVEAIYVERETDINKDQQLTDECIGDICTRECPSKFDGEKEAQQQFDVPEYNSDVPVGRSLLKWTLGLRCRMCHKFFLSFEQAEQHCQTFEHYNNYVKRISELQCALNIDPMDGPKTLELERLLEDEAPSSIPPESSYLSEVCSDLL